MTATTTDVTTLALLLGRLSRLNEALVTDVCVAHATTPAEVRVLAFLAHREGGSASPSAVAAYVVQTSGGLTATLRRLESAGHVVRATDPLDGRGRLVEITDSGRAFHAAVLGLIVDRCAAAFQGLDLNHVDLIVRDLVAALESAQDLPSSAGFVADPTVTR